MAEFAPQYNLYKVINRLYLTGQITFWAILVFSMIPVTFKDFCDRYNLLHLINILNIVGISVFFVVEIINDFIIIPLADSKRRDDFIDNSFGSAFSTNKSIGYYDNDEVANGLYKAAVNLFENCFFTYSLIKRMTIKKIIVPAIMFIVVAVLAYYGFKDVPFYLTILQTLFSVNILGQLIKHLILMNRLSAIQDSWVSLFQQDDFKTSPGKYHSYVYRYWLQYETLHAKISAGITDNIFEKFNPTLMQEWKTLKLHYNIS